MICCCGDRDSIASCDAGQTPEESYWVMGVPLGAIGDPFSGPRAYMVHQGGQRGMVYINAPISEGCVNPRVLETASPIYSTGYWGMRPLENFPGIQSLLPIYYMSGDYGGTYRCHSLNTDPNEGDFIYGEEKEQTYYLLHESTEILEDGSRKWTYAKRDWDIIPRQWGFSEYVGNATATMPDPQGFDTWENAQGTAIFTVYEKPQSSEPFWEAGYPYLRDSVEGVVSERINLRFFRADIPKGDYSHRVLEFLTGELAGHRETVLTNPYNGNDWGKFQMLKRLPSPPEPGDQFKIVRDEFMNRCQLDFRISGSLMQLAPPGEGAVNWHYEPRISFHSHMHYWRPHNANRWYAASASSCCEPNPTVSPVMRRVDPPIPLVFVQGVPKSVGFSSASWPDLTGNGVIISFGYFAKQGVVKVAGDGSNQFLEQHIEFDFTVEDIAKLPVNVTFGAVVDDEDDDTDNATTTSFRTNLDPAVDIVGHQLEFTSGRLRYRKRDIAAFDSDGTVSFEWPLEEPPANGDTFRLVGKLHTYRISQIGKSNWFESGTAIVYPLGTDPATLAGVQSGATV